jgi:hypothetical protein
MLTGLVNHLTIPLEYKKFKDIFIEPVGPATLSEY